MDHIRHSGLFNADRCSVALIGCGGIGSPTAMGLAKMGVRFLDLYDDDVVSEENLATQFYKLSDIGKPKVDALSSLLNEISDDTSLDCYRERVSSSSFVHSMVVISAVDSIDARKEIWSALGHSSWQWYLDARMSAEQFQLHVVHCKDYQWYEAMLAQQDERGVPDIPCTSKATIYCGLVAAGLICSAVRQIITGKVPPKKSVFDLPSMDLMVV